MCFSAGGGGVLRVNLLTARTHVLPPSSSPSYRRHALMLTPAGLSHRIRMRLPGAATYSSSVGKQNRVLRLSVGTYSNLVLSTSSIHILSTSRHSRWRVPPSNILPLSLRSTSASLRALPVSRSSVLFLAATLPLSTVQAHGQGQRHQHTMASESSPDLHASSQKPMLARHRDQDDASASAQPQNKGYFPLGYKDGFSQWWTSLAPAVTENKVLSFVPYLQRPPTHTQTGSAPPSVKGMQMDGGEASPNDVVRTTSITDPYGPRQWTSEMVQLAGKARALNEFSVVRPEESVDNNLVMLHGYGAGLGFFYKNFEGLSRRPNWKLYALDLLGMGRSSRPSFKINAKEKEDKIKEAESWFVDALEEWRIKRGIEKMTLLGHSLGGYMAVAYALKYPGHLNKLILASPVGIPEDPYAVNEDLPEPGDSSMQNEFTQTQDESIEGANAPDKNNFLNARSKAQAAQEKSKPPPRKMPKWLVTLWDANVSPFSIVRYAGPLGPRLVSGWTSRRFSHLPPDEAQALHDYSYSLFRQRGSGEYVLAYVLASAESKASAASTSNHTPVPRPMTRQPHLSPSPKSVKPAFLSFSCTASTTGWMLLVATPRWRRCLPNSARRLPMPLLRRRRERTGMQRSL
jgi:cardiolipin-specific phospholipase